MGKLPPLYEGNQIGAVLSEEKIRQYQSTSREIPGIDDGRPYSVIIFQAISVTDDLHSQTIFNILVGIEFDPRNRTRGIHL